MVHLGLFRRNQLKTYTPHKYCVLLISKQSPVWLCAILVADFLKLGWGRIPYRKREKIPDSRII